jgi:hypothetical protein
MLRTIDRYALAVAERFAHFMQRTFGIKPISIAMAGEILFACVMIWRWFIPGVESGIIWKIIDVIIFFVIFFYTILIYPEIEKHIEKDASRGLSNSRKVSSTESSLRVLFLFLFILDLFEYLHHETLKYFSAALETSGLVIALFFLACEVARQYLPEDGPYSKLNTGKPRRMPSTKKSHLGEGFFCVMKKILRRSKD